MYNSTRPNLHRPETDAMAPQSLGYWQVQGCISDPQVDYHGYLNKNKVKCGWNDNSVPKPIALSKITNDGWVPPILTAPFGNRHKIQPHLWKAIAVLKPVILHRPDNKDTYFVKACLQAPYAFLQNLLM